MMIPSYRDFEDFAARHGASRLGFTDPAMHKLPGVRPNHKTKLIKRHVDSGTQLAKERDDLRELFNELIAAGKIRLLSRTEKLIQTARGHDDNESVKAARRILDRDGINWQR